jgi:GT2 family glycosyltransferase
LIRIIDLDSTPAPDHDHDRGNAASPHGVQQSLDPHSIAIITPVKDEEQYRTCLQHIDALEIPPGHSVEKIAVYGGSSMTEVYQRAMEASTARYKIYLHVDTYVVNRGLLPDLLRLFERYPRLGLIGVVGSTRLPPSGIYWVNNPLHSYGRLWQNSPPGFPASLLGRSNHRRLHLMRFRPFVGDYLPAAIVDGFFLATQYDIPWTRPQLGFDFGFDLYDHVQALEFIRAGLEVGIARQEAIWCVHRGPLEEPPGEQQRRRQIRLRQQAEALRQLYPAFVRVPARRFYEQHHRVRTIWGELNTPDPTRDRLGVVVVTFNGREALFRSLRALLPQFEALKEVEYEVVVVGNSLTHGTLEAVRQEFPKVTVIANPSNSGPARAFNVGLRHIGFPGYVLVMHHDVEFSAGTLARMVSYIRKHPSTAGVVASLVDLNGTSRTRRTANVELVPRRPRRPQPVTFIDTTCALVRGDVFFDVGLYDERFEFHHQDLEWSVRAKRKGYKFTFLPEARVVYHRDTRLHQNSPAMVAEHLVANLWIVYKHGGCRWTKVLYWAQQLLVGWLAFRWRNNSEAVRQLNDAKARMKGLYRMCGDENRLPPLPVPERS